MKSIFSTCFATCIDVLVRFWASDRSSVIGGIVALCGLAATEPGATALRTLGLPGSLIVRMGALAAVFGALAITPRKSS